MLNHGFDSLPVSYRVIATMLRIRFMFEDIQELFGRFLPGEALDVLEALVDQLLLQELVGEEAGEGDGYFGRVLGIDQ